MKDLNGLPPGTSLISNFISERREVELIEWLDSQHWREDLRRRVQHYGWQYDYRARRVATDAYLGPLPAKLQPESHRLTVAGLIGQQPAQIIANEYEPGQGISAHIDCVPCFGPVVASLSLGSRCEMVFQHTRSGARYTCILEPGDLLLLSGAARFEWTHAIPARKSDLVEGDRVPRERRVSLTYRTYCPSKEKRLGS